VLENSSPIAWALTEPKGGSDARAMLSYARKEGDHYVINGTKTFITHGYSAEMIVTFAKTDKGITAFLVRARSNGVEKEQA